MRLRYQGSVRPRYNHWFAKILGVKAIVLYPYILFSEKKEEVSLFTLQHEMIHVRQVREFGWIRFYSTYLWEYFRHRLRTKSRAQAYYQISFEKEAYQNQDRVVLSESECHEIGLV